MSSFFISFVAGNDTTIDGSPAGTPALHFDQLKTSPFTIQTGRGDADFWHRLAAAAVGIANRIERSTDAEQVA